MYFLLFINDPVVFDFLTGVYVPPPPKSRPPHENPDRLDPPFPIADLFERTEMIQEPSLPAVASITHFEKTKQKEITYANSEDLIVIQNRLLHAISNLTLNERRLIFFYHLLSESKLKKTLITVFFMFMYRILLMNMALIVKNIMVN